MPSRYTTLVSIWLPCNPALLPSVLPRRSDEKYFQQPRMMSIRRLESNRRDSNPLDCELGSENHECAAVIGSPAVGNLDFLSALHYRCGEAGPKGDSPRDTGVGTPEQLLSTYQSPNRKKREHPAICE